MRRGDSRAETATTVMSIVGITCSIFALVASGGCGYPPPPPPPPSKPPADDSGSALLPHRPTKPVIVITASGPQLNGEPLSLDAIVSHVRKYVRANGQTDVVHAFTVTIEPDVRIKAENEARATLSALEEGPEACKVNFATPSPEGGRFPARGD
jgi:hypothetical protein